MSDPMADRCPALAPPSILLAIASESRRCVLYLDHDGEHTLSHGRSWPNSPWRLDVPAIPPHVTCVKDWVSGIWLRDPADPNRWTGWSQAVGSLPARPNRRWLNEAALTQRLPLIEHPDPRKAPDHG